MNNNREEFYSEYRKLLKWEALEFKKISEQLKQDDRHPGLDTHTPEFEALDKEFEEKFNALKEKYGIEN